MRGKMTTHEALKLFNTFATNPAIFDHVQNFRSNQNAFGTRLFFGALPLCQFFLTGYEKIGPISAAPSDAKDYSIAQLDEIGRPVTFLSFNELGKNQSGGAIYYFDESDWILINVDLEHRRIGGGTILLSDKDNNPLQAFCIYQQEKSIDELEYTFSSHLCTTITISEFQENIPIPSDTYEYVFTYDHTSILSKVTQNGNRIIYQSPKNFSKEASLNQVMEKLSKEISTFTSKAFPLKNITGIGIFYDVISKFSSLSISVTSQSLVGVSKLTDEEIVTLFDLQEEEFYELEDFETSSSALKKHLQFLESNWKTTDAEFSEEMNRFCDHVLELVKKKHPNVAYVFWCDRECTNLAKNIRKLASEN